MRDGMQQAYDAPREARLHTQFPSFVALLRYRAAEQPQRTGFLFLRDNNPENDLDLLSYSRLDENSRAIASVLQQSGEPGQRVLLLHQPGEDFVTSFYGCLYAGAIAVTTYPAHRGRLKQSLPKICDLLKDAECSTILTTADIAPVFTAAWKEVIGDQAPLVLASDAISATEAGKWRDPAANHDTVAFLQYTSGSTSRPRGVAISHGNMLHN